jgi:hypothetical protein
MTMLTDLNNTLKRLLVQRVPLDLDEVDVSFDCPKREWSAKVLKPTVNLYLFDVRENVEMRTWNYRTVNDRGGTTGRRRPPVYVDLSYLITTWAREVTDEHVLLWRALTAMMRETKLGDDLLQGSLRENESWPVNITVAQADGVLRNPGEFWNALDNDLKPAVVYCATLPVDLDVLIDLFNPQRVRISRHIAVGGLLQSHANGDGAGRPIADARVAFPQLGISVRSGDDGRYVASGVPEGTHHVQVSVEDGVVVERELVVPSHSYDLEV